MTIRERLDKALAGEPVEHPVFLVYDWFVNNRPVDWQSLFDQGLGIINHADLVEFNRPNVEIIETKSYDRGRLRTDIRWITDRGELHEYFLDEWQQEYLIKTPEDYRIMALALSGSTFTPTDDHFDRSEKEHGDNGITIGHLGWTSYESRRTALMKIQVELAGLERFSYDIAEELPELMELIEVMNEETVRVFECAAKTKAQHIKLWENMSIVTLGPKLFRQHFVPVYNRICDVLEGSGKKIQVHYDGKLSIIADDIAGLRLSGIDSLTPAPEGDMTIAGARRAWPDKFLWMHPCLGWYHMPEPQLVENVRQMVRDAGPYRYCLMISEDVPHDCQRTVPAVLRALGEL